MIKLFRGRALAPGCYIIARERADGTYDERDEENTVLVQLDTDRPSVASSFAWSVAYAGGVTCEHTGTDGTIDCPDCGLSAGLFVDWATTWLDANEGVTAEDPGYFAAGEL